MADPAVRVHQAFVRDLKDAANRFRPSGSPPKRNPVEHKSPGLKWYGLRTPAIRTIWRARRKEVRALTSKQRLELARRCYQSTILEQQAIGVEVLALSIAALTPNRFGYVREVVGYLNNWGATDSFGLYVLQPLLNRHTDETSQLIRSFNASDDIWEQRASLVVFTRKMGAEGRFTDFMLKMCENLIHSEHDLVRKAIGWALKDNIAANPQVVLDYVKDLRRRGVSAVITGYAISKLPKRERQAILSIKPQRTVTEPRPNT